MRFLMDYVICNVALNHPFALYQKAEMSLLQGLSRFNQSINQQIYFTMLATHNESVFPGGA